MSGFINQEQFLLRRYFGIILLFVAAMLSVWGLADQAIALVPPEYNELESDRGAQKTTNDAEEFDEFDEFDEFGEFDRQTEDVFDPLSGYNRAMTTFNDRFYYWVVKPAATGYDMVIPVPVRRSVDNFFRNIGYPARFINCVLQLKGEAAVNETARFLLNSTAGMVGFFDPARDSLGIEPHDEDFGQTLGRYGLNGGFHLVLPFFGPSNLRDSGGLLVDMFMDPVFYMEGYYMGTVSWSVDGLNYTSLHLGEYERMKSEAIDLYAFLRNAYEQNREKKIRE